MSRPRLSKSQALSDVRDNNTGPSKPATPKGVANKKKPKTAEVRRNLTETEQAAIERFIEAILAEKGGSMRTAESYKLDLQDFLGRTSGLLASKNEVAQYLQEMAAAGLSANTQARRLSCLRRFFSYQASEGARTDIPTSDIDAPRRTPALPKVLSEDEIAKLFQHCETPVERAGLEILYGTGMRVSEMLLLPANAIPLEAQSLLVTGKGGNTRVVPLSSHVHEAVRLLKASTPAGAKYLFSDKTGKAHLRRESFCRIIKRVAVRAGLDPAKVSPHVLRHSFASHILHHGGGLRFIQKLLGHQDISTTQIYTHLLPGGLEKAVQNHPLAK